ncbi:hypothetical protein EDB19DRAFT_1331194 [Suillus lakei]|nr:hypothetical protein EDB19DRAFT_1331194 [Suillus lakei]
MEENVVHGHCDGYCSQSFLLLPLPSVIYPNYKSALTCQHQAHLFQIYVHSILSPLLIRFPFFYGYLLSSFPHRPCPHFFGPGFSFRPSSLFPCSNHVLFQSLYILIIYSLRRSLFDFDFDFLSSQLISLIFSFDIPTLFSVSCSHYFRAGAISSKCYSTFFQTTTIDFKRQLLT